MSEAALKANKETYALVRKIDRNTRALAKVVSAMEYLADLCEPPDALLDASKFALIQERRNFRAALEDELKKQPGWKG